MAQCLKAAQRRAKLLACIHVLGSGCQRLVHGANSLRAHGGNADVHCVLQGREAVAGQQGGGCILQLQFGSAAAVLRSVAPGLHALGAALDQKQGQAALQHRGHQKRIGVVAYRNYAFCAAQMVCLTRRFGRTGRCVQPVALATLLVGQHDQRLAAAHLGQPVGFGRIVCVASKHGAGHQGLGQRLEHDAAPQLFHYHHAFDRAHAHAAVLLAHIEAA